MRHKYMNIEIAKIIIIVEVGFAVCAFLKLTKDTTLFSRIEALAVFFFKLSLSVFTPSSHLRYL
jgi:hypothetical protein